MTRWSMLFSTALLIACGSSTRPPEGPEPIVEKEALQVSVEDATWHDASRQRDLPVRIFAPAPVEGPGPFPLVVFSHGLGETRDAFDYLGEHWASRGFIAVMLQHLGSDREAVEAALAAKDFSAFGDPKNHADRPADLGFALDRIFADDQASALLAGRVNSERIAAAGQCAGSSTALVTVGMAIKSEDGALTQYPDVRVKAVVALGPQPAAAGLQNVVDRRSWDAIRAPALFVLGTEDFNWGADVRANRTLLEEPYRRSASEVKYVLDIVNAQHHAFTASDPWYPGDARDPRHHGWIQQVTTAFLRAQLEDDVAAKAWLDEGALERECAGACFQRLREHDRLYGLAGETESIAIADDIVLYDDARDKALPLRVSHPLGKGPYPLVLFSHAVAGTKDDYDKLIASWVSHGYVVIQPDHSDSPNLEGALTGTDAIRDWRSRPLDMKLILDSLDEIARLAPELSGKIDSERVAAAGAYIGAGTANLLLGTHVYTEGEDAAPETFEDARVDAAIALSPAGLGQGMTEDSWLAVKRPMLVVTGSRDVSKRTGNGAEWRTDPFRLAAAGDKHLLWIEDLEASYGGLADDAAPISDLLEQLRAATLSFLDATLKAAPEAITYLDSEHLELATHYQASWSRR